MSEPEKQKIAANCVSCGNVYAAHKWPDGTILPIGQRKGCECGSAEFQAVNDEDGPASSPAERSGKLGDD